MTGIKQNAGIKLLGGSKVISDPFYLRPRHIHNCGQNGMLDSIVFSLKWSLVSH